MSGQPTLERIQAIARDVSSSPTFLERVGQTAAALSDGLAAQAWSFWVMDPRDPTRLMATHRRMVGPNPRLDEYIAHYRAHDPMAPSIGRRLDRAVLLSDCVPSQRFGADPFTGEFLTQDEIRHIMGLSVRLPDDHVLVCGFHRSASRVGDFGALERRLAEAAAGELRRAAFGAMLREKVLRLVEGVSYGRDHRPERGCLVLDAVGDIAHADADALALLRDPGVQEGLEGWSEEAARLVAAPPGASLERRLLLPNGRVLRARLSAFALLGPARGVLVEFLLVEDSANLRLQSSSLTTRERQVARLAVEGLSNLEVAARLGISPATVSVYLPRTYRKTGVRGRVGLARWLLEQGGGGPERPRASV